MNDQDLFGKTPAGFEEIQRRGLKLPQRLRTMLIMVDGVRTLAQLRQAAQTLAAPVDFLEVLLAMGLIKLEMTAGPARPSATVGEQPVTNPAVAASNLVVDVTLPGEQVLADPARFRATLKFLNDSAVDLLGLRAFFFTLKLEKCFTAEDLLALLPDFSKAITKSNGADMARALEERARQMLKG